MRYWVQFLQHPLKAHDYASIDHSRLIDATGDRSVFILDGRNSQETMRTDAKRQEFNGLFWAKGEIGKTKRISACKVTE